MVTQVNSLSVGAAVAVSVHQELPQEKRPPLSGEQKIPAEYIKTSPAANTQKPPAPVTIKQTASDLEHISLAFNRRLKFMIDGDSKEVIIKVIDNETDKVIKVLPPEELQRVHSRIRETMGFLFDRMV